jgi:hypothetical protein
MFAYASQTPSVTYSERVGVPKGTPNGAFRVSPTVCQNLLGKSCVLSTSKKLCKVKKEFISNSLT